jgi:flagellar motor switch protein FliM
MLGNNMDMDTDIAGPLPRATGVAAMLRAQPDIAPDVDRADATRMAVLNLTVLRWLRHLPKAQVQLRSARITVASGAEILDQISGTCFLCAIEGAQDVVGLAVLNHSMAQGLAELQALGQTLPHAPHAQRPTRTDAALLMPLLNTFLDLICALDPSAMDLPGLNALTCGAFLPEARSAALVLEDRPLRALHCDFKLGDGERQGQLTLILHDWQKVAMHAEQQRDQAVRTESWETHWPGIVMGSDVQLCAVLHRQTMTLAQLGSLAPGAVLCVPDVCMEHVTIETLTRQAIAHGRLGQSRGQRAVRMAAAPSQEQDAPPVVGATAPLILPPPAPASTPTEARGNVYLSNDGHG